jgi:pilus assembly protein CpaB
VLTAEDLKVRKWPKEMLPAGVLSRTTSAKGRSAMVPILAGEPILDKKLAGKDAGRGLASLIPKGMRAYTIQASKAPSSVAGFILPGNRVDVLLNLRGGHDDDTGGGSTTTLLQAVEILAVDQELDAPADNKVDPASLGTVTLLVTPEQAALLDLGQNMGQLSLALRNPEDMAESDARPATLADIRFRQEKPPGPPVQAEGVAVTPPPTPPVAEEEPEVFQIVTLRGSQRGRVTVTAGK